MPDPADDAGREEILEAGGLRVNDEELRRRLAVAADLAHTQAVAAASATAERDELRWQIDQDVQLTQLRVELATVTAELDRLRSIPELRVGQRLRQVSSSVRRSDGGVDADESSTPDALKAPESSFEGSTGLTHSDLPIPPAVVTVRNRAEAAAEVISRLKALGVTDIFVVDNASSDPAVAETLARLDCSVTRFEANLGAHGPWVSGVMARLLEVGNVLAVDGLVVPALSCPEDVVDRMTEELRRRPDIDAIALSQDSDEARPVGGFGLLRQGLRSRPERVATLDAPYVAIAIRLDPSDPAERFAQLHDDIDSTGVPAVDNV